MTEDKILMTARYVEGDLNAQELAEYELRLKSDAELQTHLQDYNQIHQSLKMHLGDDTAFLHTLEKNNKRYFRQEKASQGFKLHPVLKWATGIAAVFLVAIFIWAPWNRNLYTQFSQGQQMTVTERGAEATDIDKAAALFNDRKFAEANIVFAKLNAEQPENSLVTYYYGLSLIEVNKVNEARKLLNIINDGESVYKYDATYAIALSYLKLNNKAQAKKWLQKVPKDASQYGKASLLIDRLK